MKYKTLGKQNTPILSHIRKSIQVETGYVEYDLILLENKYGLSS